MRSEVIAAPDVVVVTTTEAPGPSIEWWGWLLIVLAVVGCIGAVAAFLLHGKKKAPAKKRAIPKAPEPAPAPAPPPVATTSVSMPIAAPVYQYAQYAPASMIQAPTVYAAPSTMTEVLTAQPVYAAPAMSTVAYAQPNAASVAFGALDANHDGIITREEFAGVFGNP